MNDTPERALIERLRDWADRLDKSLPFLDEEFVEESEEEIALLREVADALAAAEATAERVRAELARVLANPRWLSIGSINNAAELPRLSRERYERLAVLVGGGEEANLNDSKIVWDDAARAAEIKNG